MKIGNLLGVWDITKMENWDKDYFNMETQAHINFESRDTGMFQFGLVFGNFSGQIYKYKNREEQFEFTWEGSAEQDKVFGYGWVRRKSLGRLIGEFRIHGGENSKFEVVKRGYSMSLEVYNHKNREDRIQIIINDRGMAVNDKTLKNYLDFLKENINLPYRVTGIDETFTYTDYKDKTPSGNEKFEIVEFEEDIENYSNLFVKVKRLSDKGGVFSLQLYEFKSLKKSTIEDKILRDYTYWIENYL